MARLRITLVTPSLNQARFIERTLQSVLSQTGKFDLEYLVMDGGSRDGTLDILHRYEHSLRWWSEPDNGQAHAINKGLRMATGDIVGWLNSDDILLPGALARIAEVFAQNPNLQWVHADCDLIDVNGGVIRRWISRYKRNASRCYSYHRLLSECFISQQTVFWRRSLQERTGLLDETLHLALDYDLWLRFAQVAPPRFLVEKLAQFRWYAESKSGARYWEHFRELYRVAQRYGDNHRLAVLLNRLKGFAICLVYASYDRLPHHGKNEVSRPDETRIEKRTGTDR